MGAVSLRAYVCNLSVDWILSQGYKPHQQADSLLWMIFDSWSVSLILFTLRSASHTRTSLGQCFGPGFLPLSSFISTLLFLCDSVPLNLLL